MNLNNKVENPDMKFMITIDGPAGSGKSTIAKRLSERLGWIHVNTGSIYRTFAFICMKLKKSDPFYQNLLNLYEDQYQGSDPIEQALLIMKNDYSQNMLNGRVFIKEKELTNEIKVNEISQLASKYAEQKNVRDALLPIQRELINKIPKVIVDGRDMGTVVFPNAPLKLFLTASPETRAKRRFKELKGTLKNMGLNELLDEITDRDMRDSQRAISPLRPATDSIIIDSSDKSIDEVINVIVKLALDKNLIDHTETT